MFKDNVRYYKAINLKLLSILLFNILNYKIENIHHLSFKYNFMNIIIFYVYDINLYYIKFYKINSYTIHICIYFNSLFIL